MTLAFIWGAISAATSYGQRASVITLKSVVAVIFFITQHFLNHNLFLYSAGSFATFRVRAHHIIGDDIVCFVTYTFDWKWWDC